MCNPFHTCNVRTQLRSLVRIARRKSRAVHLYALLHVLEQVVPRSDVYNHTSSISTAIDTRTLRKCAMNRVINYTPGVQQGERAEDRLWDSTPSIGHTSFLSTHIQAGLGPREHRDFEKSLMSTQVQQ